MIKKVQTIFFFRWLHIYIIAISLCTLQSCYHTRILTSHNDPSTNYNKKMASSFLWGLVQKDVIATECDSLNLKSLDEVRVTTNFGYALITVITLGIWCPMQVEYKCPKPCPRVGDI